MMKMIIKCECGKIAEVSAPAKKYLQLRDNLEREGFGVSSSDAEIRNGKVVELMIRCDCGNFIFLGLD